MMLLGLFTSVATAAEVPDRLDIQYDVEFSAASSFHDFEGRVPSRSTTAARADAGDVWKADFSIPVADISTDNGWRDSNMRSMFEADRYPHITARFDRIDSSEAGADGSLRTLPFTLTIRDKTLPAEAVLTNWERTADRVRFDASFDVSLDAYGLKPPSLLGIGKVADTVAVTVKATVRPASSN